jgi:predicted nucleic acid-binding protein
MKTVFVDTNVILDVLLQNEGFWRDSLKIIRFAELGEIRACVSASSITDIFYVIRKKLPISAARSAIENLLDLFEIISVDETDLRGALTLPIDDMEDALQAWCAEKTGADMLVTRNINDFNDIDIPVTTPADFNL